LTTEVIPVVAQPKTENLIRLAGKFPYLHELDAGSVNLVRRELEKVIQLKERENQE
jgi:hypothetical protein